MDMMLDSREASAFLGVGEEKLQEFVANKIIPAYMIAGKILRFKKDELEAIRNLLQTGMGPRFGGGGYGEERIFNKAFSEVKGLERFKEVLRANDIYFIIGTGILGILIFLFFNLGR